MPAWVYDFLEGVVTFMNRVTLVDGLAIMLAGTAVGPLVVLIHESGHALAALALRRRLAELRVGGGAPLVTVRARGFRLRLGLISAGFIVYDESASDPKHTLAIALAGPLASLAGALVTGALSVRAWPQIGPSLVLAWATLVGLVCCVDSLRVSGDNPASWSDGVWFRAAWRVMRRPTPPRGTTVASDRSEATSQLARERGPATPQANRRHGG